MPVVITHAPTFTAVAGATSQQGQCEAFIAQWAGGNVTVRVLGGGGALRQTATLGPFTISTTNPREVRHGARLAWTHVTTGDIESLEYRTSGGTTIFTVDADDSAGPATIDFAGPIKATCPIKLTGAVFTAQAALPVTDNPLNATLNLIAAAPAESWIQLNAGRNTMESVFAPAGLTSQLGPGGQPRIQGAWPSFAWSPSRNSLIIWGGGHANSPTGQVFEWSARTRDWTLAYHQADVISTGSSGQHRSKDYNSTPVSSHTYGNNNWLTVLDRFFTFGGAGYNSGGGLAVYDPLAPDPQNWGLRGAGAYTLDMTQAGTGKVAGQTGSNVQGTGYVGVELDGANAWGLRDWFAQSTSHPSRPFVGGGVGDFNNHIDCGTATAVEGGKDVVYYSARAGGARYLWKVSLDADPLNDVQTLLASQGVDNTGSGSQGPIALDPVRRLVIMCHRSGRAADTTVQFVDLKRVWSSNEWRYATLTGADVAEFLALTPDIANAGLIYNPIKGCFTLYNIGRQVWEIYPPDSAAYVDNSGTNLTADTGWSLVKPTMDTSGAAPRSSYIGPGTPEQETGILGKWRWASDLRCGITTIGNTAGEVWAYKPTGWTDPRTS